MMSLVRWQTLTLLFTSFSFGRMSKVKPSACPRERFPPFMKLPKASTRPRTLKTLWPLWKVWRQKKMRQGARIKRGIVKRQSTVPGDSPCRLSEGFQLCVLLRWYTLGKLIETGCRRPFQKSWGSQITGTETWWSQKKRADRVFCLWLCEFTRSAYCSGLSRGLGASLSLDNFTCFLIPSSSSVWARFKTRTHRHRQRWIEYECRYASITSID